MDHKEALDFLELSGVATDEDIELRISEKQKYFDHLCKNAPNDFLKKLHERNLEKIEAIKNLMGIKNKQPEPALYFQVNRTNRQTKRLNRVNDSQQSVGWLVRHTENQAAKTYPLYLGKNTVGRKAQPKTKMILIDDDPFVSNVHTVLEVVSSSPLKILLSDDSYSNGGKASRNGTYVNGSEDRIKLPVQIGENDTIQVGYTKFLVRANNAPVQKIVREVEDAEYMKTVVINIF